MDTLLSICNMLIRFDLKSTLVAILVLMIHKIQGYAIKPTKGSAAGL